MVRPVKTYINLIQFNPVFHNGYIRLGGGQQDVNDESYPIVFLVQTTWQDSLSGNITNSTVSRCLPQHATILCYLRSEYGEERSEGLFCVNEAKQSPADPTDGPTTLWTNTTRKPSFTFCRRRLLWATKCKIWSISSAGVRIPVHVPHYSRNLYLSSTQSYNQLVHYGISTFYQLVGMTKKVFSDNGTNIKELRQAVTVWNQSTVGQYKLQHYIEWHLNLPYASHRSGEWERLIRSTRTILNATAHEQLPTDDKRLTLMAEVERILKDIFPFISLIPITKISNDPRDP